MAFYSAEREGSWVTKRKVGLILERKGSAAHRTSMEQRKITLYEG